MVQGGCDKHGGPIILLLARSPAKPGGLSWTPRLYSASIGCAQRPGWPRQHWHPLAQGQALHLYAVPQDVHSDQRHGLLSATHLGGGCHHRRNLARVAPLQAIVAAFGFDERTVAAWRARAGRQGQAVQEYLVEQPRDLGQVQADEIRVKQRGHRVDGTGHDGQDAGVAGGEVSEHRDMALIRRLIGGYVPVPCLARCCSAPMGCVPTFGRFARPFAIQSIQEDKGVLGCAHGGTSASPKSSNGMPSGVWSTSSAASWMARPHASRR